MADKIGSAQARASRAWEKKNPERTRYLRYRSTAKTFTRNHATEEDLQELEALIKERREKLEEEGE